MLQSLSIKNFAIIENISLSFNLGFNVLIGETGSGKSIILDALSFVLGEKPSKDNIRYGCNEMSVKATFSNLSNSLIKKLNDYQIDIEDDILIIGRTFNADGKSVCKINGEIVTVSMLKQLGAFICDIYNQHDGVNVFNVKNHLKLLDSFNEQILQSDKEELQILLDQLKFVEKNIEQIGGYGEDRERTLDLLNYQINEIETANLKTNEDEELQNQIIAMSNFEKITNSLEISYNNLSNNSLGQALSSLESAANYDSSLLDYANRLSSSLIELEDIKLSLKDYLSNLSFSSTELDKLNARLDSIKLLKKKYGNTIEQVLFYLEQSKVQYDNIINCEEKLNKLNSQKQIIKQKLYDVCISLHNKRVQIANVVEKKVEAELIDLGMKGTTFKVNFTDLPSIDDSMFTNNGLDKVEFLFSANKGEEQKSLAKTISGGEMSRFMLAIKNVINSTDDVSLLIFDEIDSGVSGEIGYKVGQKLYNISKDYQIICITHLAQVTALADNFIHIKKIVEEQKTKSVATYLEDKQILSYLASLFGSFESEIGLQHAKELLMQAQNYKQTLNK